MNYITFKNYESLHCNLDNTIHQLYFKKNTQNRKKERAL